MRIKQVNNNGGGGGLGLVIAAGAVAAAVGVFDWIGQHEAEITSGIGVLFKVIAAVAVLAAAGAGWLTYIRRRQAARAAAEQPQPQPITAVSEQVPVQLPAARPTELPPGGTTLHFPHLAPADVAELVEAIKNRNQS